MQRTQFDPSSGKIPHAAGQLSRGVMTTEACVPRTCAPQREKPQQQEACVPQVESSPRSLQLEKARAATKTQHHPK